MGEKVLNIDRIVLVKYTELYVNVKAILMISVI